MITKFIIGQIIFFVGLLGNISAGAWNKKTLVYKSASSYLQGFCSGIMLGGVFLQF